MIREFARVVLTITCLLLALATTPAVAGTCGATPDADRLSGFAPDDLTVFAAILELAGPGPNRAARALAICDRQFAFQRKIWLHPEFSPQVQKILEQLPPRQGTLIRAASLYSRKDIPWTELPGDVHQISVAGAPQAENYLYVLTGRYTSPEVPFHMAGAFTLKPASDSPSIGVRGVDGQVGGEILMDTYGAGRGIDSGAALLRYFHGDLKPPWDTSPGIFNHHDQAALSRFHAQMPRFSERIEHYLRFENVFDEFAGEGDPIVLFNLNAEVLADSLKPYPELDRFYRSIGPSVALSNTITDDLGNRWIETRFERGRIRIVFMLRHGLLVPFTSDYRPAGAGLDLAHTTGGHYHTVTSATITRLGMTFGLSDVRFETEVRRDRDSLQTTSAMESVPSLVAPPGIHKIIDLIAGQFLRVLAQGDGGFKASFSSSRIDDGLYRYAAAVQGEFAYAPALEFLARIGDSVADEHSAEVKREERELGQELFDAFLSDYNRARPGLLALDSVRDERNADGEARR